MDWILVAIVCFIVLAGGLMLWLKLKGRVTDEQLRDYIAEGAMVVDVRTLEEYEEGHLDQTIHIPLDQIVERIRSQGTDSQQLILCHCVSGGRSAIAVARLRRAGYHHAFNLGSYNRAAALLKPLG